MRIEDLEETSICEELVLAVIYSSNETKDLKTIMTEVNHKNNKKWKPQTVSTFLTRLRKKGYLDMYRKGRYCYYAPVFTREAYLEWRIRRDCSLYYGGDFNEMRKILDKIAPIEE